MADVNLTLEKMIKQIAEKFDAIEQIAEIFGAAGVPQAIDLKYVSAYYDHPITECYVARVHYDEWESTVIAVCVGSEAQQTAMSICQEAYSRGAIDPTYALEWENGRAPTGTRWYTVKQIAVNTLIHI